MAVFFSDSVVLLASFCDFCSNIEGAIKCKCGAEHLLETDISHLYMLIKFQINSKFQQMFLSFRRISDGLLSVLNNELFCEKCLFLGNLWDFFASLLGFQICL